MWSGYFSSRPSFKAYVRESAAYMQAARQLQALVGGVADVGPTNPLFALERALAIAQHHDAIAGTAQQHVNDDYVHLIDGGRAGAFASIAASLAAATGYAAHAFVVCALANVTLCPALEAGLPAVVLLYNALSHAVADAPVRLSVGLPPGVAAYAVSDSAGAPVTAQLVPLTARDAALRALYGGTPVAMQWLCFTAALPAIGFAAYFLTPVAATGEAPATHASRVEAARPGATITNGRVTLAVSPTTGFIGGYADADTGVTLNLTQSWMRECRHISAPPLALPASVAEPLHATNATACVLPDSAIATQNTRTPVRIPARSPHRLHRLRRRRAAERLRSGERRIHPAAHGRPAAAAEQQQPRVRDADIRPRAQRVRERVRLRHAGDAPVGGGG